MNIPSIRISIKNLCVWLPWLALLHGCASSDSSTRAVRAPQNAADFALPSPGKAKVIFYRPNKNGGIDIGVHDGERLIAKLPGKTYGVYECAPGESMFFPAALGIWTSLMPS